MLLNRIFPEFIVLQTERKRIWDAKFVLCPIHNIYFFLVFYYVQVATEDLFLKDVVCVPYYINVNTVRARNIGFTQTLTRIGEGGGEVFWGCTVIFSFCRTALKIHTFSNAFYQWLNTLMKDLCCMTSMLQKCYCNTCFDWSYQLDLIALKTYLNPKHVLVVAIYV